MSQPPANPSHALIFIGGADAACGEALGRLGELPLPNVNLIAASAPATVRRVFNSAAVLGCTNIIAIHSIDDCSADHLAALMSAAAINPVAMIIGKSGVASHGVFRQASDMLLRLETGHRIRRDDGPRLYPAALIRAIESTGNPRSGELEILVRSAWTACPIITIPLPPPANQLHAISIRQMLRELIMHARLIARVLVGLPNPKFAAAVATAPKTGFWKTVWRWLNPFEAWRELRKGGASRNEMAVGLAVGAFIGNMPAWGFHMAISLYVARRLHLNPLAVMTGSHASAPPMGPVLVASAIWTGHVILHGSRPKWENITPFHGKFLANAIPLLLDWTLGAVLVGTALAVVVFFVANFLFRLVEKRNTEPDSSPHFVAEGVRQN